MFNKDRVFSMMYVDDWDYLHPHNLIIVTKNGNYLFQHQLTIPKSFLKKIRL